MGFTDDKTVKTGGHGHEDAAEDLSYGGITKYVPGKDGPTFPGDAQVVLHFFEVESSQWREEDYAWAPHYRDIYSMENFSRRVREQMNSYPGMHNTDMGPKSPYTGDPYAEDPWKKHGESMGESQMNYWNAAMDNPQSFMSGLRGRQQDFSYSEMFKSKDDFKENMAAMITECIPCFDRLFDGSQLLPDADLLEVHLLNINLRLDLIDKLKELFKDPGFNIDICELLRLLSHLCPQDLLAILALLSQYLAKLNLDFKFNLDLVIELVGPILSPFLDSLSDWLDKWVQMILAPIICVVDHINMTMYLAQQTKLPLSEAEVNLGHDVGIAGPNIIGNTKEWLSDGDSSKASHGFSDWMWEHGRSRGGLHFGTNPEGPDHYNPYMAGAHQSELFDTPESQKYNPEPPIPPEEEWAYSMAAGGDAEYIEKTGYDRLSEKEREAIFLGLQKKRQQRETDKMYGTNSPPNRPSRSDGTRWSTNDIPQSEKKSANQSFSKGQVPPNNQAPKQGDDYAYISADAIVEPIVQMRNIIQGGIAYIQDWFDYVVQLIHDLLGTDFGWMKKKMGQTMLKSRIIQLIYMLLAIIDAIRNTDLECGVNTNINPEHMDYMLGVAMNKLTPFKFVKRPDGSFEMLPPGEEKTQRDPQDLMQEAEAMMEGEEEKVTAEQKAAKSGIIIKNCLREVKADDLEKVRGWIADFEKKSTSD